MKQFFSFQEKGTNTKTEVIAGITTFFTMSYIIFVNPNLIGGENPTITNGVFFATCISAFIGSVLMGVYAKIPFAQAPGMGLNAFFAFTVMPAMITLSGNPHLTQIQQYQLALSMVFLSGILFMLITALGLREAIVKAIPKNVKLAISGGIGLFLAFLGLQNAGIVTKNPATFISLVDFSGIADPETSTAVMGALLAIFGLILIAILYQLKVKGALLLGIIAVTLISYLPFVGYSTLPNNFSFNLLDQAQDFFEVSFFTLGNGFFSLFAGKNMFSVITTIIVLIISFSLVDMFDSIGTLLGTAKKADLIDEEGNMIGMKKALMCDAVATTAGALVGSSTVTVFVESSAGIGEGGRTGLTSVVTGVLFLFALLMGPFIGLVPSIATAPALIFVGCLMMSSIKDIEFDDISEGIPAFLTLALMPLTFSIANGIAFGIISFVCIKLFTNQRKDTNGIAIALAILFIIRYFFMPM